MAVPYYLFPNGEAGVEDSVPGLCCGVAREVHYVDATGGPSQEGINSYSTKEGTIARAIYYLYRALFIYLLIPHFAYEIFNIICSICYIKPYLANINLLTPNDMFFAKPTIEFQAVIFERYMALAIDPFLSPCYCLSIAYRLPLMPISSAIMDMGIKGNR